MSKVMRKGQLVETIGELPKVGSVAPDFTLVKTDLSEITLANLKGSKTILNIFPSIDTPTCARSVRQFNKRAAENENVKVLCVSADLPFASIRFCAAEGIENVIVASSFRSSFGKDYEVTFTTGLLKGLLSRAIVVIDEDGKVIYTQQVSDTSDEPDYEKALAVL
ncbi:lipid hydroperoxide peroxidase [Malaciobacter molluscorum]|uniref:thiol peroxidase n=1 Tax=Malaciobacter molluscorum TaxID=1032072 RepID=UPI00100B0730|nr:thiol peroxidase [Malaciobacter molluscorum]RXJ96091.1 lipid hydroperoxide peroxidase [Malaciobacter molluscorum]